MSTDSGIIIYASGKKTIDMDMERLEGVLTKQFLPYSGKKLQAEFSCDLVEDIVKSSIKCQHQFGVLDADMSVDKFTDLTYMPANAQIKCVLCGEMFFLFSEKELGSDKKVTGNFPQVNAH